MGEQEGYSKEKADKLIEQHEKKAQELEKEAREAEESATFDRRYLSDLRQAAEEERRKAGNLKELKKHWGDE